ncbi:LysR family transcriptional regulator [Vibrio sonorensis]|uniref:LysR family transcriptional regulator n=1 Tax=Vibrio sonorensis TaxID=1004316 RepID=UPI001113CF05|nr:LysR family transcriptional regulator [Vibrio sonorensis]
MLDRIDNIWLHAFVCVYERGSFAKASEHLDVPSSNISRYIQQLESELGSKLFYRTTRKVSPTNTGNMLYRNVKQPLYTLNQHLNEVCQAPSMLQGTIRLSSPDIPMIGDVLTDFALKHTNIQLLCEHSTSLEHAIMNEPDVVISFERGPLDGKDWVSKPLCEWESSVLASPNCLTRLGTPNTLDKLKQLPCISSYKAFGGNPWVFRQTGSTEYQSLKVNSIFNADGGFIAKAAAVKGIGFVALPTIFCREEIQKGELIELALDEPLAPLTLYVHFRPISYQSFITKQLVEFMHLHLSR